MDRATIRHVAELAELSLSADEEARLTDEIGRIVGYVAELAKLDTDDVPPTTHLGDLAPGEGLRADEVAPGLSHDDALAQAPRVDHGGFSVPGFVE